MRPLPGDDAFRGRPRTSDNDTACFQQPSATPQMSFVLTDETTLDASLERSNSLFRRRDVKKLPGHEKPKPAPSPSAPCSVGDDKSPGSPLSDQSLPELVEADRPFSNASSSVFETLHPPLSQPVTPTMPLTPTMAGMSSSASIISTPSSRRNSLTGSLSDMLESQALSVAGGAEEGQTSSMMDSGSAPQLIMPSIKMPSRRPFTELGKNLGRLKVLVAGDSGAGKTSLLKAIVQTCEHIVHVDPIAPSPGFFAPKPASKSRRNSKPNTKNEASTTRITEIFASTKPYPLWWSELEDSRLLKRRKSLGDTVLDRNVCFVDTPGYGSGASCMDVISPIVQYVESHLTRVQSNSLSDSDMLNLLGGDGCSQVDVVLYVVANELRTVDLEYMGRLAPLTNIVPVLTKVDVIPPEQLERTKERVRCQLDQAGIRPFTFAMPSEGLTRLASLSVPFATSSASGSDYETMDASLLMSPDYVQPLAQSELSGLVEQLFSSDGSSWLRHSAARKYVQWRKNPTPSRPADLYRPIGSSISPNLAGAVTTLPTGVGDTSKFALARLADHTQREERLAQIRLANWAAELQRSLANERARYDALAQSERAVWLTQRLGECVKEGTLVPISTTRSASRDGRRTRRRTGGRAGSRTMHHQDPLGLLDVAADLRRKGWVVLEVLGSLGVIGGVALWLSKQYHNQACEWLAAEWGRVSHGER